MSSNEERPQTKTRRHPLTGDTIEEADLDHVQELKGLATRAHHNRENPGESPYPDSKQASSAPSKPEYSKQEANTKVSYDASGNKIEEHDGQGSLPIRALYNEDDDSSRTYSGTVPDDRGEARAKAAKAKSEARQPEARP
ncbi:Protein of unknown function [Pyronema omphalodes CBS 100304]|uniref:Uncharacterized protein n=1 Tax=Pyronema omphalodes (strain CBS 100304) TaxID=1076935 RepID=U4L714_PYROM|nr:Protein of unknown function [Pyronema omphalodes CBS 100304]